MAVSIEGKRVALTGRLRRITRSEATSLLEDLGAEVTAVVTDGTDLVVAGADSTVPHLPDVPVIDETGLEKLLSGAPLSTILGTTVGEEVARPPLPAIAWSRDGAYRRGDPDGRVLVEGTLAAARMHGTWRYYWPDGSLRREVQFEHGLEHGSEREWTMRGTLAVRGQHARGLLTGTWEWLHDDGVTVSTRTEYVLGEPHGEHRELHPDGSPRVIGRNVRGRAEGVWAWLAPDGTRSERSYRNGFLVAPPAGIEADKKLVDKVVRAVKRADDRVAKESALEEIPSEGNRFVLMHLWRLRALELPAEPELWDLLAEAATDPACGVTGAELVEILGSIPAKAKLAGGHLDGWPVALDRAACHVLARDPRPFIEGWQGMAPAIRRGIDSVLARAGMLDKARLPDLAEPMAKALVGTSPIPPIMWFHDGRVIERPLVDDDRAPLSAFDELVALYASAETWARASLARAFARGVKRLELARMHAAAALADESQLASMIERAERPRDIAAFVLASRLPPPAIGRVALAVEDPTRRQGAIWGALVHHGTANEPIPDALVDDTTFVGAIEPNPARLHRAIAALPAQHEHEPALVATCVRFTSEHHPLLDHLSIPLRAASALGALLREVIVRDLAARDPLAVMSLLHLVDEDTRDATLAALHEHVIPTSAATALGMLPVRALPALVAARAAAPTAEARDPFDVAIVAVCAHAASAGAAWPREYDSYLRTDLGETVEQRRYIDPLVCAAIAALPEDRAEAALIANLDRGHRERFTRAFALLGLCATPRVMAHALDTLLGLEPTLLDSDLSRIEAGLSGLVEPNEWVRWLLAASAGSRLGSVLVAVVGNEEKLESLRAEVAATGARVARALDSIDVIESTAARFAESTKQTIYLLRPVDDRPSDAGLNRIGGVPIGVTTRRWPKRRGKPMAHLFTLDVQTMPALGRMLAELAPDARTVSLFVANPEDNAATEPGNDWAKVLIVSAKDVAKGELAPPSGVDIRPLAWFEPVGIDVPTAVFNARAGALRELRDELAKHPRVLGDPTWVTEPAHSGSLVAQFGEGFAEVYLGERGRMFVFTDTAFWQSG